MENLRSHPSRLNTARGMSAPAKYATLFSGLALAACSPYPERTHAGPLAGPSFHDSQKPGDTHPPYYGHSHTHYLWNHDHTHPEPHKMDNYIDLRGRDGKITRIKNPHPTYPNHPVIQNNQTLSGGQSIPQAEAITSTHYTVQPGDTAGEIAQKYNLPYGKLKELNPGVNLNFIQVGQILKVQ